MFVIFRRRRRMNLGLLVLGRCFFRLAIQTFTSQSAFCAFIRWKLSKLRCRRSRYALAPGCDRQSVGSAKQRRCAIAARGVLGVLTYAEVLGLFGRARLIRHAASQWAFSLRKRGCRQDLQGPKGV